MSALKTITPWSLEDDFARSRFWRALRAGGALFADSCARSSDGVDFKVHRAWVATRAPELCQFLRAATAAPSSVPSLPAASAAVDVLLDYVYGGEAARWCCPTCAATFS